MASRPLHLRLRLPVCLIACLVAATPRIGTAATLAVPESFTTIQEAIREAEAGDVIQVSAGNYSGSNLEVEKTLTIEAVDGAKVVLSGTGDRPLIRISGVNATVVLRRLILNSSGVGISITAGSVTVSNLVITSTPSAVAIECSAQTVTIQQVTVFRAQRAISCANAATTIVKNNIFSNIAGPAVTLVAPAGTTPQAPTHNLFFQTPDKGPNPGINIVENDPDPLFVDVNENDFHLKALSPAIDAGDSGGDLGAYGGSEAHSVPFAPRDVGVSCGSGGTACTVSWAVNADHQVTGYRVYFASPLMPTGSPDAYSGTATVDGSAATSPVSRESGSCGGAACQVTLADLDTASVAAPAAPTGLTTTFGNAHVVLAWSPVAGATVYQVFTGIVSPPSTPFETPKSQTTRDITNLVNGATYYFAVQGIAEPTITVAIASVYGTPVATVTTFSNPSAVKAARYGVAVPGALSVPVSETPEPVEGFPPLEDAGGCFIATAAYGSPMAPQVEMLRAWRDRHLRPHWLGRWIIHFYETVSPSLADAIRDSAPLRAGARAILWPAVGAAGVWLAWPWAPSAALALAGAGVLVAIWRRRVTARG